MSDFEESRLDDPTRRARIDGSDMLRGLATAGAQVRRAQVAAHEAGVSGGRSTRGERPRGVHVAAVGGAETVGSIVEMALGPSSPAMLTRGGSGPLPGWVGPLDLVVAVSLSGAAVGPVRQAREAARRGAHLVTIGPPDSPLAAACAVARGVHVPVTRDWATEHSRTALWGLAVPALMVAADASLATLPAGVLGEIADRLDAVAEMARPDAEHFVNPAKGLALSLAAATPVLLGDGPVTGAATERLASQLARTARLPATWGRLPDAAAQVIACFSGPLVGVDADGKAGRDIFADPDLDAPTAPLTLLLMRDVSPDPSADPREIERHNLAQAVADGAQTAGLPVVTISADPGHDLVRFAGMVAFGDFAATYLAVGHGLDPARAPGLADVIPRSSSQSSDRPEENP